MIKSKLRWILVIVCLIIIVESASAQRDASIWFLGGGHGLDFNKSPSPQHITTPADAFSAAAYATISDASGNLLFYTDSHSIFGTNNQVLENGGGILGSGIRQMIIPKPGTPGQYYLFYTGARSQTPQATELMYCVVDMTGNGKVLEKNVTLYVALHGYFAISGSCGADDYWLVGEADRNVFEETDKLYAFHITATGISSRVVSSPVSIGNSGGYKFSPDGQRLTFFYSGNPGWAGTAIADFDRTTGEVSNAHNVGPCCGFGEFAANGSMLYVNYFSPLPQLIQYDLNDPSFDKKVLADNPDGLSELQLGPDRKIYSILTYPDFTFRLAVINKPEQKGAQSDYSIGPSYSISGGSFIKLPEFPSTSFYQSPFKADAGPDVETCAEQALTLGGPNSIGTKFEWTPSSHLNDAHLRNPTFLFDDALESTTTFTYILKVEDDQCAVPDTVNVTVNPKPKPMIYGSRSVCPGVEEVEYWTDHQNGNSYEWLIEGGQLVSDNDNDTIRVNWGTTNPSAKVKLRVTNASNCVSVEVIFPVKINVELDTETPHGLLNVCANLRNNNVYSLLPTNGSIYTWGITGGEIKQGQGSGNIIVDWREGGEHKLWVTEKSITIDTVCYGVSDTIRIKLYADSLRAELHAVSVVVDDDTKTNLTGTVMNRSLNSQSEINMLRTSLEGGPWELWKIPSIKFPFTLTDTDLNTDENIYYYKIKTTNGCQIDVQSVPHHTIRLKTTANEANGKIALSWNSYEGWPSGVDRYEIWRKIDADTTMKFQSSVGSGVLSAELYDANLGFTHNFRIKAVAAQSQYYSWSNEQSVTFEHPLFFPNVFTPNGDALNETFQIKHISLYSPNELIIYNRWGEEVYNRSDYTGDWDASGLPAGVYYYRLAIGGRSEAYKGWVQVVK